MERGGENRYVARIIRRLARSAPQVLGIYERTEDGGGRVRPTDKKAKSAIAVDRRDSGDAEPGDLVTVELLARSRNRLGMPSGRVIRSEERRVGKRCVRTCRSRWSTEH